jgi:hypothetical protein
LSQDIDFGATGVEEVFQNVKYILLTEYFSVPLDREFGMDFTMVDKPIPIAEAMLTQEIAIKISLYEPRCQFTEINFEGKGIEGKLNPLVTINILSTDELLSRYPTPVTPSTEQIAIATVYAEEYPNFLDFLGSLTKGPEGPPGLAATVDCGETYTGDPGTRAMVENVGDLHNAIFEFTIPRGDQGVIGPHGVPAYTFSIADFTIPAIGETVVIDVEDVSWATTGEFLWVEGAERNEAGSLKIVGIDIVNNRLTLENPIATEVITEAPIDGKIYGRQDASWTEVGKEDTGTYNLGHYANPANPLYADMTVGANFTVSVEGKLVEVSFYKTAGEASFVNHAFILWDTNMVPLWNHPPDSDPAVEGWITHKLPVPIPLTAGTYILGIHVNEHPRDTTCLPYTDGPLTENYGCWIEGNGFPNNNTLDHFGLDLVFEVGVKDVIAPDSITTAMIQDGAVTGAKIADGTITDINLAEGVTKANLGFTPLNKAGDSMTGNLSVNHPSRIYIKSDLGLSSGSYASAKLLLETTVGNAAVRPGIGFHLPGNVGAYLYLDTDGKMKFIDSSGTIHTITST